MRDEADTHSNIRIRTHEVEVESHETNTEFSRKGLLKIKIEEASEIRCTPSKAIKARKANESNAKRNDH